MDKNTAYQTVKAARSQDKILTSDLIKKLVDGFFELHGDRKAGDDPAVIAGIGYLADHPITVVGISKGKDTDSNIKRHFGSPTPEGYRKAIRVMKQAEKFHRPILALVNTPGAYPDVNSEYHGQGEAIAQCLLQGMQLKTPYISIILGEGGSGGAIALCCGDQVYMVKDSMYSVLSPEGYASIMWKDAKKAPAAAAEMGLTPQELLNDKIVDQVLPEIKSDQDIKKLAKFLNNKFTALEKLPVEELVSKRQQRYARY
ncbi:MAG TPA: acetyl-CoA carboxylase carboxyl transferase subunit alpha [Lactobacillus acetotolerans]|nr:acetyl-CoA carboxylase carboxyl transferase subunit alpha [Lactobacillus acetotolerans]